MTVTEDRGDAAPEIHSPVPPSRGRAWTVLFVVVGCSIVVFLDKVLLGLAAEPLMQDLHLTHARFGTISSASYLLYGVVCLIVGFLADRISPRWVLLVCGIALALGQVPVLFAATGSVLYASRVFLGAAEGPSQPLSHSTAYSWFPNDRRGVPAALIICAAAIAKIAIAPLVTIEIVHWGWRSAFLTVGALALVWSALWLALGRVGPYAAPPRSAARKQHDRKPAAPDVERTPWHRLLLTRTFLGSLVLYFMQGALAAAIFTWLPMYFEKALGFSKEAAGSMVGVPSGFAIVALLGFGALSDRWLRRGVSSRRARALFGGACMVVAGLALVSLRWIDSTALAIVAVVVGYGLSTIAPSVTNTSVAESVPASRRSGALGVLTALGNTAGIVSPIFVGKVLDAADTPLHGYTLGFLVFGLLVVAGGVCFGLLADPRRDGARALAAAASANGG